MTLKVVVTNTIFGSAVADSESIAFDWRWLEWDVEWSLASCGGPVELGHLIQLIHRQNLNELRSVLNWTDLNDIHILHMFWTQFLSYKNEDLALCLTALQIWGFNSTIKCQVTWQISWFNRSLPTTSPSSSRLSKIHNEHQRRPSALWPQHLAFKQVSVVMLVFWRLIRNDIAVELAAHISKKRLPSFKFGLMPKLEVMQNEF